MWIVRRLKENETSEKIEKNIGYVLGDLEKENDHADEIPWKMSKTLTSIGKDDLKMIHNKKIKWIRDNIVQMM